MRNAPIPVILALLFSATTAAPPARPDAAKPSAPEATAQDLGWLAGCWATVGGEPGSGEHWSQPAGGTLLGLNRVIKGGRTVATEFLMIRPDEAGRLVYVAMPSGQTETHFAITEASAGRVVFENPEHDFPQRIRYQLQEDGHLVARIEGPRGDQTHGIDFPLRRIDCEADLD